MHIKVDTKRADIGRRCLAVTAAEDIVDTATLNHHRRAGDGSSVATAEDTIDSVVARVYIHAGPLASDSEIGVLATTEDVGKSVAGITHLVHARCVCRSIDIDCHILLWRTVGVVAAIDIAADGGVSAIGAVAVVLPDIDCHQTVDLTFGDIAHSCFAQTTTEDVTLDLAVEDVDGGDIGALVVDIA